MFVVVFICTWHRSQESSSLAVQLMLSCLAGRIIVGPVLEVPGNVLYDSILLRMALIVVEGSRGGSLEYWKY